jgi:hypothetical protein
VIIRDRTALLFTSGQFLEVALGAGMSCVAEDFCSGSAFTFLYYDQAVKGTTREFWGLLVAVVQKLLVL